MKRVLFVLLLAAVAGCVNVNVQQDCSVAANITACEEHRAQQAREEGAERTRRAAETDARMQSALAYNLNTYGIPFMAAVPVAFLLVALAAWRLPRLRGAVPTLSVALGALLVGAWLWRTGAGSFKGWLAYSAMFVLMAAFTARASLPGARLVGLD